MGQSAVVLPALRLANVNRLGITKRYLLLGKWQCIVVLRDRREYLPFSKDQLEHRVEHWWVTKLPSIGLCKEIVTEYSDSSHCVDPGFPRRFTTNTQSSLSAHLRTPVQFWLGADFNINSLRPNNTYASDKKATMASDIGWWPVQCQAIIGTNA